MKKITKGISTVLLAMMLIVGCNSKMSVSPSVSDMHSTERQTATVSLTPTYPRITKMHSTAIQTDTITLTTAEWIEPDEELFYSGSSLIIEAKVLETEEIRYENSADFFRPFSIHKLKIDGVYKDSSGKHKAGDEVTIIQEFNSEQRPSDLKIAEAGHTYMFFLTTTDSLQTYPLLVSKADYYFVYSYHCLFEKLENHYVSLNWAKDYSTKAENLRIKLGISYSVTSDAFSYKTPSLGNVQELQDIQKDLELSPEDYEWLFTSNPVLHDAEEFLESVKEHIARYP